LDSDPVPPPPRAAARAIEIHAHGRTWSDDYAWIRADNWREVLADPSALPAEIRALLEAENAYAEAMLAPTREFQGELKREMRARLKEDDREPPTPDGPWSYYSRFRQGGQHRLYCRTPRDGGDEAILIDGDARAAGKSFFQLGGVRHSPDHRLIAWSADDKGSEMHVLGVVDLLSGTDLADRIENTTGAAVWTRDSRGLLYVLQDENHRPWRVMLHRLGGPVSDDVLVYEESDPAWFLSIGSTRLGRRAFISVHGHDATETRVVDLDKPTAAPLLMAARRPGLRYHPMDHGDVFYIRANHDGAKDFQIVVAPADAPEPANWRTFLPTEDGRLIEAATLFENFLALLTRGERAPRLIVIDLVSGVRHEVAFEAPTYTLSLGGGYEFSTTTLRFGYSTMASSQETYDYDMATRERRLVKKQMEPPGFEAAEYELLSLLAPTSDGEQVPVSVLRKRGAGPAPLLIYGYGAYGHAMDASFSSNRFSLVDRGFAYAIAHVRGGTDKGFRWYEDGKLAKKANTFSDFIAATRHLIAVGVADPAKIIAHGGSAGGMLMGAIANQAPELYAGIIADVPFVDVLNTMRDETLPLTPPEWLEWGDPIRDVAAFEAMRAYSPYDNVSAQAYPAILALAGLADPRVTYWEPAKWVAKLRAKMTGGGPILLHTSMGAGHGGAPGRFDRLDEVARIYAFAIVTAEGRWRERP
jgi:oligopeptidase B